MSLKELIQEKRPNLSEGSIKTYISVLNNLHKKIMPDKEFDIKNFNEEDKIIKYLKDLDPVKRRTILSAVIVITDEKHNKKLKKMLTDDRKTIDEQNGKNEKTEVQKENWQTFDQVKEIVDKYKNEADLLIKLNKKKEKIEMADLQKIQNFIILLLCSGVYIDPRRSQDWVEFKIKDVDKDNDNYFERNTMIFNKWKIAKKKGQFTMKLNNKDFLKYFKLWLKINPYDWLLIDSAGNKLSNIYLSNVYKDMPNLNEMKERAEKMGHSLSQGLEYVKKD